MDARSNKNIRIGDVLKEFGYVTDDDINAALEYSKTHEGVRLGGALIELNIITERQMLEALGRRLQYSVVNISDLVVDIQAVETIPQPLAEKYGMMAYKIEEGVLYVLTNDPLNFYGLEDIRQVAGTDIRVELTEKQPLENAIQYCYSEVSAKKAADKAAKSSFADDDIIEESEEVETREDIEPITADESTESAEELSDEEEKSTEIDDKYLKDLQDSVDSKLSEYTISSAWNIEEDILNLTTNSADNDNINSYDIPMTDLKGDIDTDTDYIMGAVGADYKTVMEELNDHKTLEINRSLADI